MSWQDQGRQYHMWFGSGHGPVKLRPVVDKDGSTMEDGLDERLRTVVHGAIGALPRKLRGQAEQQLQAATLARLTEAMAAWIYGSKMDGVSFAHHFFDRDADDPVVGSLRAAASETVDAETRPQLAKASEDLADAMKAIGLDRWPRFVADAQKRAHEKATLAAIQTSRQPPDLHKDAIKPLSFSAIMVGLGAAIAAAELDAPALIAVGAKAKANKVLGDKPAPAEGEQDTPQTAGKEGAPESKPTTQTSPADKATGDEAGANGVAANRQVALDFYTSQAGFSEEQALQHIAGIDLTQPVKVIRLDAGTVLQQYVRPGRLGNYFAPAGTTPLESGLTVTDQSLQMFQSERPVNALLSTAKPNYLYPPGDIVPNSGAGGGTQYFIPDNTAFVPIK